MKDSLECNKEIGLDRKISVFWIALLFPSDWLSLPCVMFQWWRRSALSLGRRSSAGRRRKRRTVASLSSRSARLWRGRSAPTRGRRTARRAHCPVLDAATSLVVAYQSVSQSHTVLRAMLYWGYVIIFRISSIEVWVLAWTVSPDSDGGGQGVLHGDWAGVHHHHWGRSHCISRGEINFKAKLEPVNTFNMLNIEEIYSCDVRSNVLQWRTLSARQCRTPSAPPRQRRSAPRRMRESATLSMSNSAGLSRNR